MINTFLIYTYAVFGASYLLHLVHYNYVCMIPDRFEMCFVWSQTFWKFLGSLSLYIYLLFCEHFSLVLVFILISCFFNGDIIPTLHKKCTVVCVQMYCTCVFNFSSICAWMKLYQKLKIFHLRFRKYGIILFPQHRYTQILHAQLLS